MTQLQLYAPSSEDSLAVSEIPCEPQHGATYTFTGLSRAAVTNLNHGLHKYPAKFIPQLPRWALDFERTDRRERVLDPFCGSGTTLVEAGIRGHHAWGFDISPLAVEITRAKTSILKTRTDPTAILQPILRRARRLARDFEATLRANEGQSCLGLHHTWSNWFQPADMARLIALRHAINDEVGSRRSAIASFLLVCVSSIAKSASFLNEDQIKVRYDKSKQPRDPFMSFARLVDQSLPRQAQLSALYRRGGAKFVTKVASATDLPLPAESIDRVITSPPYINAVDYSMAHKYNLFILDLLDPVNFKDHCREYIGVTERAVRMRDISRKPESGIQVIDEHVDDLWNFGTPVSRNRAFVVGQFFTGMNASFAEQHRVLRRGGKAIMVIGATNRICGSTIPTGDILRALAERNGFRTRLLFYHLLANRSSMRLNRSSTGGIIKHENIYVFEK
ncbi:MAG: hypothetical protein H7Z14_10390 [Anaerolineae bacterium]|nr:hypothetical protein [Phycisphaerae bacterium]